METILHPPFLKPREVIRSTWLSREPNSTGFLATAVSLLLIAIVSVISWTNYQGLAPQLSVSFDSVVKDHQVWRLFIALFAHADAGHFLSNAFLFFILGSFLTAFFGVSRVLMSALFWGAITNFLTVATMPSDAQLLGASGVVYWMGGAWLTLYLLLDTKRSFSQRALRALGVGLVLFMPSESFKPSTSYTAHAIGFFLGNIWAIAIFIKHRKAFQAAEVRETIFDDWE